MRNPWQAIPTRAPYVLACDRPFIDAYNRSATATRRVQSGLLPEPFFGPHDAPIVLLLLNPGFSERDRAVHRRSGFQQALRAAVRSRNAPHFYLQEGAQTPGGEWWSRCVASLRRARPAASLATKLLAVEYFPYHSVGFGHAHLRLPSQAFSFQLVERALARRAEIVIARGFDLWIGALPALAEYPNVHRIRNPRQAAISPGNLRRPSGHRRLLAALGDDA